MFFITKYHKNTTLFLYSIFMKNIIKDILKKNNCFYYKLDEEKLTIQNKSSGGYLAANELVDVSKSLDEKNIRHNVDGNQSIHILK